MRKRNVGLYFDPESARSDEGKRLCGLASHFNGFADVSEKATTSKPAGETTRMKRENNTNVMISSISHGTNYTLYT